MSTGCQMCVKCVSRRMDGLGFRESSVGRREIARGNVCP
jgi:hypothetical protein